MTLDNLIQKAKIFEIHLHDENYGSYEEWANICSEFGLYTYEELKKFATALVSFSFAELLLDEPAWYDVEWYIRCKKRLREYFL